MAKVQGGHISFRRSTLSGGEWTLLADPTVTTSTVQFKVFDSIIEGGAAVGSGVAAAVEVRGGAMRMDDTVVSDHSGVVLRMTNGGTLIHNGGSVSSNTSSSAIIEVDTGHLTSYEVDHTDNTAENLIHFIGPLAGSTPSITGQLTFSSYTDNDINNATILSEGHTVEITANESVFARNNAAAEVDLTVGTTVNLNGVLMDDGISVGVTGQGGEVITGCSTSCTEIIATSPLSVVSMGVETNSSKFVGSSNFQDSQLVSSSTLFDGALNLLNGTDASLSGVTISGFTLLYNSDLDALATIFLKRLNNFPGTTTTVECSHGVGGALWLSLVTGIGSDNLLGGDPALESDFLPKAGDTSHDACSSGPSEDDPSGTARFSGGSWDRGAFERED